MAKNTAIKRIHADVREMLTDPSDQYVAEPLEENLFDWHFTLRGPRGTAFESGIYHGRILLPPEYPFKPPHIIMLTPNGRFEVRKKICLSISAYHPEHWQPAWGIRLILEALISFFPTPGEGAVGALDYTSEERRRLAKLSQNFVCEKCGKIADLLPEEKAPATVRGDDTEEEGKAATNSYAEQISQLHFHGIDSGKKKSEAKTEHTDATEAPPSAAESGAQPAERAAVVEASETVERPDVEIPRASTATAPSDSTATSARPPVAGDRVDEFLWYLSMALAVLIVAMLYQKLLLHFGILQNH